jgi:hypothetical protein
LITIELILNLGFKSTFTSMSNWVIAILSYLIIALSSFIPVLLALLKKVKLNPGGDSFNTSPHFSDFNKLILAQHFTRIHGTLIFWKNEAAWYKRLHFYTLVSTIPISILIPIISQSLDQSQESKIFLTVISSHVALLIGFHRGLKVENNYKAFRNGESEFYDLYRRMLDRPTSFGNTEEKQIENYFRDVEFVRKTVRNAETDNFPNIEDTKPPSKT